jgi:hypothetical protein
MAIASPPQKPRNRKSEIDELLRKYDELIELALEKIDYWCWNVSGDPVEECYAAHSTLGLGEIIDMYLEKRDRELLEKIENELIAKMGKEKFDKYLSKKEAEITRRLERVAEKLSRG